VTLGLIIYFLLNYELLINRLKASMRNYIDVLNALIQAKANLNTKDNSGCTPLIWGIYIVCFSIF
jgi:hypothetical protein